MCNEMWVTHFLARDVTGEGGKGSRKERERERERERGVYSYFKGFQYTRAFSKQFRGS